MSSVSRTTNAATQFKRGERLKNELVRFATKGPLKDEYLRQRKLFFESAHPDDEREAESVLDWFLFDWLDENDNGVITHYLVEELGVDEADREVLLDWLVSINSVFEILSAGRNSLQLQDLDGGDIYDVKTRPDQAPFKRGQFIIARLLPLGDDLIFSGLQFLMPDRESALAWLDMNRAFAACDSPEAIEKARREQVTAFCDLFGCDELTVASAKLNSTLERFQRYLLTERRDKETGLTPAERFRKELGQELSVPDPPPILRPVAGAGEVTILCDEFEGIVLLPDFTRFKRVFETDEPDRQVADWKDLVWSYIKNPEIPTVAFERVAELYPLRVEKVIGSLVGDKDFSLEHLYAVLLHYKQPVDGLEDLKDDEELWDLFNGNSHSTRLSKTAAKPAARTKSAAATKRQPAKANTKQRAKKSMAAERSVLKRKPVAKLIAAPKSGAAARRQGPSAKTRARKNAPARKR